MADGDLMIPQMTKTQHLCVLQLAFQSLHAVQYHSSFLHCLLAFQQNSSHHRLAGCSTPSQSRYCRAHIPPISRTKSVSPDQHYSPDHFLGSRPPPLLLATSARCCTFPTDLRTSSRPSAGWWPRYGSMEHKLRVLRAG